MTEAVLLPCGFSFSETRYPKAMKTRQIRRFLILGVILMLPLSGNAQKKAGDSEIGLGVAYGFDVGADGEMGMNVNLYRSLTDGIRIGADFIYYLLNDPQFQNPRFIELNGNANYHLVNQEMFRMYVLVGVHFAGYRYNRPVTGPDSEESKNEFGLNAGGGTEFDLEGIILFVESKRSFGGFDQYSITFGGRFIF